MLTVVHPRLVVAAVALALLAPSLHAQTDESPSQVRGPYRNVAGAGGEYAQPVSQFRMNVDHGWGLGGYYVFGLDQQHIIGIRADLGFSQYGSEEIRVPLSSTIGRISLRETTSNNIVLGSIGPQLSVPSGPIRPYVNAGIGFAYFYTSTELADPNNSETLASNTNYSDNSLAYTVGGGFTIPFGRQPISLDLGARYNAIGTTHYLTKGDIVDDPTSPSGVIITPRSTDARFVVYHLGATIAF